MVTEVTLNRIFLRCTTCTAAELANGISVTIDAEDAVNSAIDEAKIHEVLELVGNQRPQDLPPTSHLEYSVKGKCLQICALCATAQPKPAATETTTDQT